MLVFLKLFDGSVEKAFDNDNGQEQNLTLNLFYPNSTLWQ